VLFERATPRERNIQTTMGTALTPSAADKPTHWKKTWHENTCTVAHMPTGTISIDIFNPLIAQLHADRNGIFVFDPVDEKLGGHLFFCGFLPCLTLYYVMVLKHIRRRTITGPQPP